MRHIVGLRGSQSGKLRRRIGAMAGAESGQLHHHRTGTPDGLRIIDPLQPVGQTNGDLVAIATDEFDGDDAVIAFYIGRGKLHDMPSGLKASGQIRCRK
ncbi:hypothetical protein D3C80_847760 [compost metagenome]